MAHLITLRDLEFDHDFAKITDRDGRHRWHWVALGMPRIKPAMAKCVFFLFEHRQVGPGFDGPNGSGFFVAKMSDTLHGPFIHYYAVSNKHVVNPSSTVRVATLDGGVHFIERDVSEWVYSNTDDLAAIDLTDDVNDDSLGIDVTAVSEALFVTRQSLPHYACLGDQTIMLGLFADHDGGSDINLPVARFGNLAAVPDDRVPVQLYKGDAFNRPAFLNDMRSRTGFSGSPVWTWHNPYDDLSQDPGNERHLNSPFRPRSSLTLIGVHRGQFWEQARIVQDIATAPYSKDSAVNLPSSMTVIVPSWQISTLLNKPELAVQRSARDARPDRIAAAVEYGGSVGAQESVWPIKIQFPPQYFVEPKNFL